MRTPDHAMLGSGMFSMPSGDGRGIPNLRELANTREWDLSLRQSQQPWVATGVQQQIRGSLRYKRPVQIS